LRSRLGAKRFSRRARAPEARRAEAGLPVTAGQAPYRVVPGEDEVPEVIAAPLELRRIDADRESAEGQPERARRPVGGLGGVRARASP
jgi:hypothetical protein